MATLVICGSLLLLAARGATSITTEKERDTWTALLGTPLEASEIILAKFWGTLYAGRWMLPLLGFLWLLGAIAYPYAVIGIPLVAVTIAILASFFSAVGVAFSLRCANSTRSLGATLAVCVVLGGGYYLCCGCLMVPLSMGGSSGGDGEVLAMVALSPWPPYLAFVPHFAGALLDPRNSGDYSDMPPFVAAYLFGNFAYLAATGMILSATIASFNQVTGRQTERSDPRSQASGSTAPTNAATAERTLLAETVQDAPPPPTGEQ
jgi:hypothetical protein